MLSPYKTPPSSNTHTRKQKFSNHTELDLKMTSKDIKMTSNDLKRTTNEPVKNKRNNIKGGDPSENQNDGRHLLEKAFLSN